MTNAPENFESFVLPDELSKLEYTVDTKLVNSGTFKLEREDHTMGNLLRMQLMRDKDVVFVGYRQPHPLEHHILLRVQTTTNPTGSEERPYLPTHAMQNALNDLHAEISCVLELLSSAKIAQT